MISIIAAIGSNNELGRENKLIWYLPQDLQFFKKLTLNKTIVMGYNTFVSLGRILPNRKHIVITSKNNLPEEVKVFHSFEDALDYIKNIDEVFIIGGASIYRQFLGCADRIYLTEIEANSVADTFFPTFNKEKYTKQIIDKSNENGLKYKHVLYKK